MDGSAALQMAEPVRVCAGMRLLPNTVVARPVQSCLRGHKLHHLSFSVLMQSHFLSGHGLGWKEQNRGMSPTALVLEEQHAKASQINPF